MSSWWLIALLGALTLTYGCSLFFSDVSSSRAKTLVAEGALLVDVRTPEEFASGHLEGAINIPVHELTARLASLGPKSQPVVLYCRSGARSSRAQAALRKLGYEAVYNLGAMSRW